MARQSRKIERAARKGETSGATPTTTPSPALPDPFGPEQRKQLLTRLGLPLAAAWVLGGSLAMVAQSPGWRGVALGLPLVVTLVLGGIVVWALRQAKKARSVAGILQKVQAGDDRQGALAELEKGFKKNDPAAVFARAQLELQDDPRRALATLETIQIEKVMAPVADEARVQRALIHLMLGEVAQARQLVDSVKLDRHQDPKTRAMVGAVAAEAWARSGAAQRASDVLGVFDADDAELAQIRPQILRARAYVHAHTGDVKAMRRALRALLEQDARLLGGFLVKKTHPLLQKEAKKLLEQSGQMPRKVQYQRA